MKKLLILLFSFCLAFPVSSQKIKGYLGNRNTIGFNTHMMPALNFTGSYVESSFGNDKTLKTNQGKALWNFRNEIYYTYNISRVTSIKLTYSNFKTGFSYRFPDPNTSGSGGVLLPYSLKGESIGLEFQFYFNRDMPAPIGFYYALGLNMTRSKLVDEGDLLYGDDGLLNKTYGVSFSDPGYRITEPFITTGFGKKYLIAKDKLLLNIGFNCSLAPASLLSLIPEKEENLNSGYYSSSDPVYYNDEPKGFGEIDDKAILGAKQRTRGLLSTDFFVGLSWLF